MVPYVEAEPLFKCIGRQNVRHKVRMLPSLLISENLCVDVSDHEMAISVLKIKGKDLISRLGWLKVFVQLLYGDPLSTTKIAHCQIPSRLNSLNGRHVILMEHPPEDWEQVLPEIEGWYEEIFDALMNGSEFGGRRRIICTRLPLRKC